MFLTHRREATLHSVALCAACARRDQGLVLGALIGLNALYVAAEFAAVAVEKGQLSPLVYQLVGGLRSAMGYVGAANIMALRNDTQFIQVTAAGLRESHPHDVVVTKEAPNYRVGGVS